LAKFPFEVDYYIALSLAKIVIWRPGQQMVLGSLMGIPIAVVDTSYSENVSNSEFGRFLSKKFP
jgi:hypothetical protein